MSSVVNKSGTRFVPKVRQRRSQAPARPVISKPVPVVMRDTVLGLNKDNDTGDNHNDDILEGATQVATNEKHKDKLSDTQMGTNDVDNSNGNADSNSTGNSDSDSDSDGDSETQLSQESTQVETSYGNDDSSANTLVAHSKKLGPPDKDTADVLNFKNKDLHLNNLDKISANKNYNKSNDKSVNTSRKRLSSISITAPGKPLHNSISIKNEDATLNTFKRRKLSTKTTLSKKMGSKVSSRRGKSTVSKISVPSITGTPISTGETFNSNSNRNGDNDTNLDSDEDESLQGVSDQYKIHVIKSVREIPNDIEDKDSSKYLIDENNFTIAELCKKTLPIGEVSDNFERSKMAYKVKSQRRKELRELRQRARSEFKSLQELNKENEELEKQRRKEAQEELMNAEVPEERFNQTMKLKLNADGTIAVDEESTVVDRHRNASLEHAQKKKVDENPFNNLFNNGSYGKNSYTDPWTPDEMVKFYRALSMWGTDFNLISQLFPYRTRRQVKAKFNNEEKKHPLMIELALRSKLPADFEQYCRDIRKNIPTLEEFEEKIKSLQNEHQLHIKELEAAKQTAKLEDQDNEKEFENKNLDNRRGAGGFTNRDLQTYRKKEVILGTIDDIKRKREEEERKIPGKDEDEEEEESEEEEEEEKVAKKEG